jgi:hypothetical protein
MELRSILILLTMHGHMNVKFTFTLFGSFQYQNVPKSEDNILKERKLTRRQETYISRDPLWHIRVTIVIVEEQ